MSDQAGRSCHEQQRQQHGQRRHLPPRTHTQLSPLPPIREVRRSRRNVTVDRYGLRFWVGTSSTTTLPPPLTARTGTKRLSSPFAKTVTFAFFYRPASDRYRATRTSHPPPPSSACIRRNWHPQEKKASESSRPSRSDLFRRTTCLQQDGRQRGQLESVQGRGRLRQDLVRLSGGVGVPLGWLISTCRGRPRLLFSA